MAFYFSDNFDDNSLDVTNWTKSESTNGSVTETGQHLEIVNGDSGWNGDGVITTAASEGNTIQVEFDVTAPTGATNFIGGLVNSSTLTINTSKMFTIFLTVGDIKVIHDALIIVDTLENYATGTMYSFRLKWDNGVTTLDILGGAWSVWTEIYTDNTYTQPSSGLYCEFQSQDAINATWIVDNFDGNFQAVVITNPTQPIYQRSDSAKTMPLAGTYYGDPTNIDLRVIRDARTRYDTFDDKITSSTAIELHGMDIGGGWAKQDITWANTNAIITTAGVAVNNVNDTSVYMANALGSADSWIDALVRCVLATSNNGVGIQIRTNPSAQEGYVLRMRPNESLWQLYRWNTTGVTLIDTISQAFAVADYRIKLQAETVGSTVELKVWIDSVAATWVTAASTTTVDSSADRITDIGRPAIFFSLNAQLHEIKDFSAGIINAATEEITPWAAIDTAPAAGDWSGTVSVPEGAWYNIEVRFSNDTARNSNSTYAWGVGVLIGCIGQSQMQKGFEDGATIPDSLTRKYNENGWTGITSVGNLASALGNTLAASLSVPIGLLDFGHNGSALRSEAEINTTTNYWLNTASGKPYDVFKTGVTAVGGSLEAVVWAQGESDAYSNVDNSSKVTYDEYRSAASGDPGLEYFITSRIRVDVTNGSQETSLPFIISPLGRDTTGGHSDTDFQDIRDAQIYVADNVANCHRTPPGTVHGLRDTVHYDDAGFTDLGAWFAQSILFVLGIRAFERGAYIRGFVEIDATTTDIYLSHHDSTDFTPITAITAFRVLDAGTPTTISAAIRQNEGTIRLTHTAVAGARTCDYLYGVNPAITGVVKGNDANTIPLDGEVNIPAWVDKTYKDSTTNRGLNRGVSRIIQ